MKNKIAVYKAAFYLILIGALITALYLGAYDFNDSIYEIVSTYLKTGTHTPDSFVLIELRIPRILMAILTGAALAICGTSLQGDRKSTRLNSSHVRISYAVFCLKKKKNKNIKLILLNLEFTDNHVSSELCSAFHLHSLLLSLLLVLLSCRFLQIG